MKDVFNSPLPNFHNQPLFADWAKSQDSLNKDVVGLLSQLVSQQREQSKQIADLSEAVLRLQKFQPSRP
ncbi:MAG: hypothetical protein LAD29_10575 [Rhodoferax sp.]|nr:hypothetical protein [Rhodoferax sp.]